MNPTWLLHPLLSSAGCADISGFEGFADWLALHLLSVTIQGDGNHREHRDAQRLRATLFREQRVDEKLGITWRLRKSGERFLEPGVLSWQRGKSRPKWANTTKVDQTMMSLRSGANCGVEGVVASVGCQSGNTVSAMPLRL